MFKEPFNVPGPPPHSRCPQEVSSRGAVRNGSPSENTRYWNSEYVLNMSRVEEIPQAAPQTVTMCGSRCVVSEQAWNGGCLPRRPLPTRSASSLAHDALLMCRPRPGSAQTQRRRSRIGMPARRAPRRSSSCGSRSWPRRSATCRPRWVVVVLSCWTRPESADAGGKQ